jgi:serine O-acetyltransferase
MTCVWLFRASHFFFEIGWHPAARWCWLWNVYLTGADIAPACEIGGGLLIPHAAGIAVYGRAGERLMLLALSGIGSSLDAKASLPGIDDAPRLGNGVTLAPHSGIYGRVDIGDQVDVSAGCVVSCSVPDRTMVVPRPLMFRSRKPAGMSTEGSADNTSSSCE